MNGKKTFYIKIGTSLSPIHMVAVVKIAYDKSISSKNILINPIGLVVEEIQLSKEF